MRKNMILWTKINMLWIIAIFIFGIITCAHVSPEVKAIHANQSYNKLDKHGQYLVERIIEKIDDSALRNYYFGKLTLLLDTPTKEDNRKNYRMNYYATRRSIAQSKQIIASMPAKVATSYINREEEYEAAVDCDWKKHRTSEDKPFFYVCRDNPKDLRVKIKVLPRGPEKDINKIFALEDMIEKHLYIEGFSVNLILVNEKADDVFVVNTNPRRWATSHNWTGSHAALAHELMHLMGLPDEYDGIESHAGNQSLAINTRLWYFLKQLIYSSYPDSANGIMCNHFRKPLDRHACAAVGLDDKCVDERIGIELPIFIARP